MKPKLVARRLPRHHSGLEAGNGYLASAWTADKPELARECEQRFEAICVGWLGESPKLERWAIPRVLVTTSWLQRLARGICSRSNDCASARWADRD